jgi:adenosylcobinamide-GDP ribazoletransferase
MILGSLITAIRTLTILPVPGREAARPADSFYFFPLVGEIIGGAVLLVVWLIAAKIGWAMGAAWAGIFVLVCLTRALHLDGLSDTVDAFFAAQTREKRLEIMKDPHIGAFGAAAVVLALLCKAVSIERLCSTGHWGWIILPIVLSRTIMVLVSVSLPYARAEGGKAQAFFAGAKPAHFWVAGATAVLFCWLQAGNMGLLAASAALTMGLFMIRWMKRNFGGATGDLLGCAGEKTECALYFFLALISVYL